ncbi:serine hydrolase [Lysobacter sp. S4-A87]|uniref:serine hydrolase domain-containing protein n=1 Tax=Lysobacter sp. S4-A87 TaxID=2925843 RepID=UPI001F53B7B3|nr:serine hydrolase [Lysobacter sp. S4-A87]UNK50865.1 serine hydrolase [Lysobacter sp. S4-A87]
MSNTPNRFPYLRQRALGLVLLLATFVAAAADGTANYFPPRGDWERMAPAQSGFDPGRLQQAIAFAQAHEAPEPRDQAQSLAQSFGSKEPDFGGQIGPTAVRAGINGLIVHRGRVIAEFGDTHSIDMGHSVTKTFLSTVVGLAWQDGRIGDTSDRVAGYMPRDVDLFAAEHNAPITWEHLLRQTSDWQGTLWGKPDWADRPSGPKEQWPQRARHTPGSHYMYNDVRVNVLALAALQVWRQPLPQVLRERVMDPIGASSRWRWHGYRNSWIELDGEKMQSVSGGGHWGGGMFIDSWDLARFGYLFLRDGRWQDRQIISPEWIAKARTPGTDKDDYGYCNWFLNTGRKALPSAPASSVTFRGNGQNIVYIDWDNDLLIVVRWIDRGDALDQFIGKVLAARRATPQAP